jgi:ornithine carbamoyltransferase
MVQALADYSGVPVYNGLTDLHHPTQTLADLMTVQEVFGQLKGIKLVFVGDGRNNVARSLLIGCTKLGTNYTVVAPEDLQPDEQTVALCREYAEQSGSKIEFTADVAEGVKEADVLYTDVWVSMGEEEKSKERLERLSPYQVNEKMMAATGKRDTIFMHCLPAVKGNEVAFEVIESPASKVWDEAENRKHTIKAVMLATI